MDLAANSTNIIKINYNSNNNHKPFMALLLSLLSSSICFHSYPTLSCASSLTSVSNRILFSSIHSFLR